MLESDWMYAREDACVCERPVLPDAPIVIVHAAAWFIINLFIILLVQIANKMGSQKEKENLNFCGRKRGRSKSTARRIWRSMERNVLWAWLAPYGPDADTACSYSTRRSA
jgi:hypothetical protein